jgi:hypothetical protein
MARSGWITFASLALITLGVLNLFQGITAWREVTYYQTASGNLLVWNYHTWGWVLLFFGIGQILLGLALMSGKAWARWLTAILAVCSILVQIGFLSAYPAWSVINIALAALVLWAVTAHGEDAPAGMDTAARGRGTYGGQQAYGGQGEAQWESAGTQEGMRSGTTGTGTGMGAGPGGTGTGTGMGGPGTGMGPEPGRFGRRRRH